MVCTTYNRQTLVHWYHNGGRLAETDPRESRQDHNACNYLIIYISSLHKIMIGNLYKRYGRLVSPAIL